MPSTALVPASQHSLRTMWDELSGMYVTFTVSGQLFGLKVAHVREIFFPEAIYHVPMAPRQVAGLLNLRGRIVTVIDMRDKLSLLDVADDRSEHRPSITTDRNGELYSLQIDKVGDIIEVDSASLRPVPTTVSPTWKLIAKAVCRLDGALMVILDIDALFDDVTLQAA